MRLLKTVLSWIFAMAIGYFIGVTLRNFWNFHHYAWLYKDATISHGYDQDSIFDIYTHWRVMNNPDRVYEFHDNGYRQTVSVGAKFHGVEMWSIEK